MAALTANFDADFSKFNDAVQQAVVELDGFEKGAAKAEGALDRMASRFSGEKVIQDATLMAEAIERLGGVSTLTEAELARVGKTANEAVDKMTKLGVDVPKNLQELADATKGAGDQTESLGLSVGNLAASYITAEAAIRLVEGAYHLLVDSMQAVIASASDAEEADSALLAALTAQGTAVPSVVKAYDEYAVALQATTRYSDDAAKAAERILAQIGGVMPRDMARAVKATADLATVLNIDLSSAAMMVAKAAEGQTTALKKAGIVIETTKGQSADFGDVLTQLEAKMHGAAEAAGTTFPGELDKLANAWDNVLEATGRVITNNATVRAAIEGLNGLVGANTGELNANATANKLVSDAVILTAKGIGLLVDAIDFLQKEARDAVVLFTTFKAVIDNWAIALTEAARVSEQLKALVPGIAGEQARRNVAELNTYLDTLHGRLAANIQAIADAKETSAGYSEGLAVLRGKLDDFTAGLEATRGQTVALTTAQDESADVWDRQTGAIDAATMAAQEHAKALESLGGKYVKLGADVTALAKAREDAAFKEAMAANAIPPAVDAADDAMLKFTDNVTVSATAATGALQTMVGVTGEIAAAGAAASAAWATDQWTLSQNYVDWLTSGVGSVPRGALGGLPMGVRGMAAGGPVSAGTPFMVGERGPELFVPSSSGAIVPHGAGGGAGGATVVTIAPGAFVLNYPIVNNPAALDQLARTVGDAIVTKLTRAGARL